MATVDSLQNYELTFTMELASDWSVTGGWQSIFHIGDAEYQRFPGIWFRGESDPQPGLHVRQTISYCSTWCEWGVWETTGVTFAAG